MDVVGVVLGVVVLGEQPAALHPVVVRLTGLDGAGPGERQLVERLIGRVPRRLGVGKLVGDPPNVHVEQGAQHLALAGAEGTRRYARRRPPALPGPRTAGSS